MNFKGIEKWSFWYFSFRKYAKIFFMAYHRRLFVRNYHHVKDNSPIMITPNHQNTLMDALAVIFTTDKQPVFVARADIFKKKAAFNFLTSIKIMPVFRSRDGKDSLQQNDEIFDNAVHILKCHRPFVIMPEGSHEGHRRLRPLKKGFARIAFKTEETSDYKLGLKIIPVGVDYEHYIKFRSTVFVNYGEPILLSNYIELYKENPNKATLHLKNDLTQKIKDLMIHIEDLENYDAIYQLKEFYTKKMIAKMGLPDTSHPNRFDAGKKIIEIIENKAKENTGEVEELYPKILEYTSGIAKLNLRTWLFDRGNFSIVSLIIQALILIIGFPVHIMGLINNYVPYKIPENGAKKVKDPQFISSFRFGISAVTFLIYYLILIITSCILIDNLWIWLGYLVSIPLTGYISINWWFGVKKFLGKCRFNSLKRKKDPEFVKLRELYNDLHTTLDKITDK